jgi:hypothetical protein
MATAPFSIFSDAPMEATTSASLAQVWNSGSPSTTLGRFGGYTATRLPVTLVFSQWFDRITDAIENERKLKK